jgi:hypothetical protein
MEKTAYKLLKKLYRTDSMSVDEVNTFTSHYVTYLKLDKLIEEFSIGGAPDGAGGTVNSEDRIRITLYGRDYIEQKRKDFWAFWLPYAITTAIAIAALVG